MAQSSPLELLFIVGGLLLVAAITILAARRNKTLTRSPYAIRSLATYLGIAVLNAIADASAGNAPAVEILVGVVDLMLCVLVVLWSVHRTQDIGWPKWLCLLMVVPLAGIFFWLLLLFKKGQRNDAELVEAFD